MRDLSVLQKRASLLFPERQRFPGGNGAIFDSIMFDGAVRTVAFGRFYKGEEQDWTTRAFQKQEDSNKDASLTRHLPEIARSLGVNEMLVPSIEFGTRIVTAGSLNVRIRVGEDLVLRRGVKADGCLLKPGESFMTAPAGCSVCWIFYQSLHNSRLAALHIARNNLERMAEEAWKVLRIPNFDAAEAHVMIGFPIDPMQFEHRFDDPEYGEKNRELCERLVRDYGESAVLEWRDTDKGALGRIDMGWIIREQFKKLGVPEKNIHGTPSYESYLHTDGLPLWYTTRGPFGEDKRRNLVIVMHNV